MNGFSGTCEDREQRNGQLRKKATYKDGKLHGKYLLYHNTSGPLNLQEKATYKDGNLHGKYRRYFSNGKVELKATYKDGKLHGKYRKYYYRRGHYILIVKGTYKDGERQGMYFRWFPSGQLDYQAKFKDGKVVK